MTMGWGEGIRQSEWTIACARAAVMATVSILQRFSASPPALRLQQREGDTLQHRPVQRTPCHAVPWPPGSVRPVCGSAGLTRRLFQFVGKQRVAPRISRAQAGATRLRRLLFGLLFGDIAS